MSHFYRFEFVSIYFGAQQSAFVDGQRSTMIFVLTAVLLFAVARKIDESCKEDCRGKDMLTQ